MGIRNQSWMTLIVNSLLETNMGLPYLFYIHLLSNRKRGEGLKLKIDGSTRPETAIQ